MMSFKTIDLIYIISFLDLFAVGLIFPIFPQHLRDLGASHIVVGLLTAIYSAIQVVSGPLIGSWSDIRDRQTVLKTTLLVCATCYLLLGLTNSLAFIFVLRIVLGIAKHTQSICKALITDLIALEEQSEYFAKSSSVALFGFIIGPFVGGNLVELTHGFAYVSFLTAVLLFVNYILACYLPVDIKSENLTGETTTSHFTIWNSIKAEFEKSVTELQEIDWSQHWYIFLLKFLLGFTMTCYFTNQGLYLKKKYHLSRKYSSYMISYFSVTSAVTGWFLKTIHSILGYKDIYTKMCMWYIVLSLSFLGLHLSQSLIAFIIILIPLALSAAAIRAITTEMMFKRETLHKGSLTGASNSIMSVARFITPLFVGVTNHIFGQQSVMLITAIPPSIGYFVSLFVKRKYQESLKNK